MNIVSEAFKHLIPSNAKQNSKGIYSFDCPSCGDKKKRGNMIFTGTGGVRYYCWNGGCEYERSSSGGWEPTNGLVGRSRKLFEDLGGNIDDIPREYRSYKNIDEKTNTISTIVTDFPYMGLPELTQSVWISHSKDALDAQEYLRTRCPEFNNSKHFYWSPKYKRYIIIPFTYKHKNIGWIARKIDKVGKGLNHIKCANFPTHYLFNQDIVHERKRILVQEGTFDAIAFKGLASFGNILDNKQIQFLKQLNKEIILLPDYKRDEWKSYWEIAKSNKFKLSTPDYSNGDLDPQKYAHIKDAGESITRNGLLFTIEEVMKNITDDYDYAKNIYNRRAK